MSPRAAGATETTVAKTAAKAATASAASPAPPAPIDDASCRAFQDVVELVGRRWNGAILLALARGHRRFGDIRAQVDGLSDRLLSQRLKQLDDAGLVRRTVVPTTPVQVLYELTERGLRLITALQPLVRFGVAERDGQA